MTVIKPTIKQLPLKENQYYPVSQNKTHIFLHHTAGGSAVSTIASWAANPEHIATAFVLDRDGVIYQCFDERFWAHHLKISSLEKASIGIEICSYGALDETGKTYIGKIIPKEKTVDVDFRNQKHWEAYTPEQISSLKLLLPYLMDKFKIKKQPNIKNFWEYQEPDKLPPGIYSHTTVRKDKIDIFPQRELVDLVYNL